MYQAIVFLPLLGAILAGLISLYGASRRFPGAEPSDDHHAAHGHAHAAHAAHDDHAHGHDDHGHHGHGHHEPHESPLVMLVPLAVLSLGAIAAGYVFDPYFVGHDYDEFWKGALFFNVGLAEHMHHVPMWVKLAASVKEFGGNFMDLIRDARLYQYLRAHRGGPVALPGGATGRFETVVLEKK